MASRLRECFVLYFLLRISLTVRREKMYKTHIKQWGLDKKNKEFEMRAIVRKNKRRADQGKGSIIRVRGRIRDFAEVVRYWERKGVSIDDIIARQTASPTPDTVECFTPMPSPILTPHMLAIPERIFHCIRDYFNGSFESGTWVRTEPHLPCYSTKPVGGTLYGIEHHCYLANSLMTKCLFQEARQTLNATNARIEEVLLEEHPETLLALFRLINIIRDGMRDEIVLIILRKFSALGKVLLGSEHPLSRICEWVASLYASDVDDLAIRCMKIMTDQFEKHVGPMHDSTLIFRMQYIDTLRGNGNVRIQMLQKLLGECEKTFSPHDPRHLPVRHVLAHQYFAEGYYVEAMTLAQINWEYTQNLHSTTSRVSGTNEALYMLAKCQYARGDVALGIENLHNVIASIQSKGGQQDSWVMYYLVILEAWYLEQGHRSSAAQVRDWWQGMLPPLSMSTFINISGNLSVFAGMEGFHFE